MTREIWERMLQEAIDAAQRTAACVPPAGMPPLPPLGQSPYIPPSSPAPGPPPPPVPALNLSPAYKQRYGHIFCAICGLEVAPAVYCKGHPPTPASAAQDSDCDSTLETRIAECQGK